MVMISIAGKSRKGILLGISFIVIFLVFLLLYVPSFRFYFFQDDWFVLSTVKNTSINNILELFRFRNDVIYYRPLGMQVFFYVSRLLFGLNPFGFHLIALVFHLASVFMLGLITNKIFHNKLTSIFTSFFYATAAIHYMSMSWLSLTWIPIGTFLILSAIYYYLLYTSEMKIKYFIISFSFFLLSLLTTEFALTFPPIAILLGILKFNFRITKFIRRNILFILSTSIVIILYLYLRFIVISVSRVGEYGLAFNAQVIKNIPWYMLWLIGIPEQIKYQIIVSKLKLTQIFLDAAQELVAPFLISWLAFVVSMFTVIIFNLNRQTIKLFIISILIFFIGLTPVLLLPNHSYPYYLNISSIGLFMIFGYSLTHISRKKVSIALPVVVVTVLTWYVSMYLNLAITQKTHWIPGEASASRELARQARETLPRSLNNLTVLVISDDENKMKLSLMDQYALQIVLNNLTSHIFYGRGKLEDIRKSNLIYNNNYIYLLKYE